MIWVHLWNCEHKRSKSAWELDNRRWLLLSIAHQVRKSSKKQAHWMLASCRFIYAAFHA